MKSHKDIFTIVLIVAIIILAGFFIFNSTTTNRDLSQAGLVAPAPDCAGVTTPVIKITQIGQKSQTVFTAGTGKGVNVNWQTCNIPKNASIYLNLLYNGQAGGLADSVSLANPNGGTRFANDGVAIVMLPASLNGKQMFSGKYYQIQILAPQYSGVGANNISELFTIANGGQSAHPNECLTAEPVSDYRRTIILKELIPEDRSFTVSNFSIKNTCNDTINISLLRYVLASSKGQRVIKSLELFGIPSDGKNDFTHSTTPTGEENLAQIRLTNTLQLAPGQAVDINMLGEATAYPFYEDGVSTFTIGLKTVRYSHATTGVIVEQDLGPVWSERSTIAKN